MAHTGKRPGTLIAGIGIARVLTRIVDAASVNALDATAATPTCTWIARIGGNTGDAVAEVVAFVSVLEITVDATPLIDGLRDAWVVGRTRVVARIADAALIGAATLEGV